MRPFSLAASDRANYSKYKLAVLYFILVLNDAYTYLKFIRDPFFTKAYVTKEAQDTPMDMGTSTDRNATTLFFTELIRGRFFYFFYEDKIVDCRMNKIL